MAFSITDNLLMRVACYSVDQVGFNILYARVVATVPPVPTEQQTVDALSGALAGLYKACLPSSVDPAFYGVSLKRIDPAPVGPEFTTSISAGPGMGIGDRMPTQIAGLIGKRVDNVNFPGRRGKGRMYIPFPTEDMNAAGQVPTLAYRNALQAIANFYLADQPLLGPVPPGSITLRFGMWRALAGFANFVAMPVRQKWATQRRRGAFGKMNPLPW